MIRVVIADDHPIVLTGLERLLAQTRDITVVAQCANGTDALAAVSTLKPDVAILDLAMPEPSGLTVIRQLRDAGNHVRVVLLTAAITGEQMMEALRLGVAGVVLKELAPDLLVQTVRKVAAGGRWFASQVSAETMDGLLRRQTQTAAASLDGRLTPRETELVRFVAAGLPNKDIAGRLGITEGTVKAHLFNVYKKLGVASRVQLALLARTMGIV